MWVKCGCKKKPPEKGLAGGTTPVTRREKPAQPLASCQASPCTHNPPRVVHTLLYSLNRQRGLPFFVYF